jgi:hypothetical protein
MKELTLALTVCLCLGGTARASDSDDARVAHRGEALERWLELQRSGAKAASPPAPVPADEAARAYRAFLRTYDHEIPPFYFDERGRPQGQ